MIEVRRRARSRPDRAGDPLDGLVNLFDLGIVLALAFLLAALSSLELSGLLTREQGETRTIVVEPDAREVAGRGRPIGTVYRLEDGRTVLVSPGRAP